VGDQQKRVSAFAGFTALEAPGRKRKKVGCASRTAKLSTVMKRAKAEPSGAERQDCRTACFGRHFIFDKSRYWRPDTRS